MSGWRRAGRLGGALAAAGLALAGCKGGAEVAQVVATPTATAAAHGNRLTAATISDPKTFNPVLVTDTASGDILRDIFDGLVQVNPFTGKVEPMLAVSWELNADGTQATFHLRHDVRWHDGKPFTAADVAFTFEAIYHPRVPNSAKYILLVDGEPIKTEIVDDYTIRFLLPRPFAPLLYSLGVEILPRHLLADALANDKFTTMWGIDTKPEKIIGTGPYKMTQFVPGQSVRFKRNDDYWMKDDAGATLPYIPERITLIVPSQDTMYLKFRQGQTDILWPRPEEVVELRKDPKVAVQEVGLDTGTLFVSFNRNPRHWVVGDKRDPRLDWFTDEKFLLALAHAIDKPSLIQNTLYGFGKSAVVEISPENKLFHNPNPTDYPYDLGKARQLLAEGGYVVKEGALYDAAGNRVEFSLFTNSGNQIREKMCSIFKEDWEKLGIKVNYKPLDFTTLVEKIDTSYDWDAVLIGFTASLEPNNGANFLRSDGNLHVWNPRQEKPSTEWEAEIDKLLDQGSRELDLEKRKQFYWRIQEILHDELPFILTVYQTRFLARRTNIEGLQPTVWSPGIYREELIRIAE